MQNVASFSGGRSSGYMVYLLMQLHVITVMREVVKNTHKVKR